MGGGGTICGEGGLDVLYLYIAERRVTMCWLGKAPDVLHLFIAADLLLLSSSRLQHKGNDKVEASALREMQQLARSRMPMESFQSFSQVNA